MKKTVWDIRTSLVLIVGILIILSIPSCSLSHESPVKSPPPPDPLTVPYPEIHNQLLALILKWPDSNGGHTVVKPDTAVGSGDQFALESNRQSLNARITREFNTETLDLAPLVSQLFELNNKYSRLTLESSVEDGYYVDYDGYFARYFEEYRPNSWERLRRENRKAECFTTVSLPAYEPQTGYLIVYMGVQCDWEMGFGGIYIYHYSDEVLKLVGKLGLWVS